MEPLRRHLRAVSLLVLLIAVPAGASAHGRPPFVGRVALSPTDSNLIVARGTWGLVRSFDGGANWEWICAAAMGFDPTREDPAIEVTPDGSILVGDFNGVARSAEGGCEWMRPEPELTDQLVIDLSAGSESNEYYAVRSSGVRPDQLFRSPDGGLSWQAVGDPFERVLLEKVRVAPSDGQRIYLSGAIVEFGEMPRQAFLIYSENGGTSFERTELELMDGERNAFVLAVDPTNPDRAMVRMVRRLAGDPRNERLLLTEDGGETFRTVLEARIITEVTFSADGSNVYVSSRGDGLFRSVDGGETFTQPLRDENALCVTERDDEIWLCLDEVSGSPYAVGHSDNRGTDFEPFFRFSEVGDLVSCDRCQTVGFVCPEWFPDLAFDLGLAIDSGLADGAITGMPRDAAPGGQCGDGAVRDGSMFDGGDGGIAPPRGSCGCRIGGGEAASNTVTLFALVPLLLLVWRRRPA